MDGGSVAIELLAPLAKLRETETLVDFEIQCGSRTWKVHKTVPAMHSTVLLRACNGNLKEAQTGTLDLSAHQEAEIDRLVSYMYTLRYAYDEPSSLVHDAEIDLEMYIVSDKYQITELQKSTLSSFVGKVGRWDLPLVIQYAEDIARIIAVAYEHSIEQACRDPVQRLVKLDFLRNREKVSHLLQLVHICPEYGVDLIKHLAQRPSVALDDPHEIAVICNGCMMDCKSTTDLSGGLRPCCQDGHLYRHGV